MINLDDPRQPLLQGSTTLHRLERIELQLGRPNLYIKRDDHMELGLGGNKLRSLEFWLGEALSQAADVVLVAGQPISNQCRLTAAAASTVGLDCIILHNAEKDEKGEKDSFLNQLFGASVRFLGQIDEDQRGVEVNKVADELRQQGRRPYIIGNPVIGALGYVVAAEELLIQSQETGAGLRHIFLPGSMGPTEAGFIFGNMLLGNPFDIHLVSVEYSQDELAGRIDQILAGLSAHTGRGLDDFDGSRIHYHMDYLGGGYDQPTQACEQAILTLARTEGILCEFTYTGKTFAGFLDLARQQTFPEQEAMCIIHTGGTPSLFSQFGMFKTLG